MNRRRAFTLLELLAVIAIIAILSAIIFPVFARARDAAFRSSDLTSMNTLRTALQLYRADQGGYPPHLLGYVNTYSGDPLGADVIPADQVSSFLYPKRVGSIQTFRPSQARFALNAVTTAVWPNADPRAPGSAPILDLNGDGRIDAADDFPRARQRFQNNEPVTRFFNGQNIAARFYQVSGFDVAEVRAPAGGTRWELRYALFWTDWGIEGGSPNDDPRQLGYQEPPDNTVVTWNSYFRDYSGQTPQRVRRDQILFLGGGARYFDSRQLFEQSWRVLP